VTCPVCGTVAVPGARFCHNCGSALPAAATLPATERRIVTVLFGDLSEFTAWAEDVDPERVGAVTDRVLAALAGAVKTFGGHVDKLTGDGIMAVFGAPVAHEDDAERAIRAALSMQRAVRRVLDDERGGGAPTGLRVGVNTGPVVAGVQAAIEYTVIGDTVNTAARLADAAAVGAVYAGATTSTATRHVASWRALRPLRLKGKREPVAAFELLGLLDAPGTRSGLGDEAPFVGREPELAWVASRLADAVDQGEPRTLVVTGEAGLGKTRFAGEVERLAAGYPVATGGYVVPAGARVLTVHCAAFGELRRLAPLADLVRAAIGLPADSAPMGAAVGRAQAGERLRRLVQRLDRERKRFPGDGHSVAVEQLLALLGYGSASGDGASGDAGFQSGPLDRGLRSAASAGGPGGGRTVDELGRDALTRDGRQASQGEELDLETTPAAVADLLSALAAESPVVVIVDDLHDATAETIDGLAATLERLSGPVLVLMIGRPELVRTAGIFTRLADAEVYALPPLRGADASRLLTAYLSGGRLAAADADRLLATAQGNPYYLAELVTLLRERGALTTVAVPEHGPARAHGPLWKLTPGSLSGRLLSRDLAAVLAARIDALPADARAVLRDAAVVGDTVPAGAVESLQQARSTAARRPAAVAAVELERAVDELLQRRMLRRVRGGYAFVTPLLREAAYAGIGKANLADRHAALVHWAIGGPNRADDGFIADHAERATALAEAVRLRPDASARAVAPIGLDALARLAERALAGGEPTQAARYSERAAALGGGLLSAPQRLVHARALVQLGKVAEALQYAEKIAANATSPLDAPVRAGALLLAGRGYELNREVERARAAWREALDAATAANLPGERAAALRRLGMADYRSGRLTEAAERFRSARQIAVAAEDRRSEAWSLQDIVWVTVTRGDFAGADGALLRAARRFAELGDPVGRAWLRGTTAFARLLAGRLAEARRLATAFLPFGERVGEAWAVGTLRAVGAYAAAELGDLTEADAAARRAFRDFSAADDDWGRGLSLVVRGVVARGLGEPAHARDLLNDALVCAERTGHPLLVGMAGTVRGFVHLELNDPAAAAADADRVLSRMASQSVLPAVRVGPRALRALADLAAGDTGRALGELSDIAADAAEPSLLFPRRQAVAGYAQALLTAGCGGEALSWARRAVELPAEDVRSRVVAGRVLAAALSAAGERHEALAVAAEAVREAYGTQQISERHAADATLAAVG
jgi:class 3 adenylate cyclase/tetratricopeptide (TPR) repeat protein